MRQQSSPSGYARFARIRSALSLPILLIPVARFSPSQATSAPPSQLQTVQTAARSAILGSSQPTSISLSGTFTSTEGSLRQSGSAQFITGSDGSYSITLSRTAGPTNESRTVTSGIPSCIWTDQENVVHNSSFLNCMPPAWFFPHLTLFSINSDASNPAWAPSSYISDTMGDHLRFQFMFPSSDGTILDPRLSNVYDLILAPETHLPAYAMFTAYPDNMSSAATIPILISYSDYRSISGVAVPFHIQRYVNGSLVLDLVITAATVQ